MPIPILETPRLILRPLEAADFADFYEYAQDPPVASFGMWQPYASESVAREDFDRLLKAYDRGLMWWALQHKADGKMIGRCQLGPYDDEDARADISYALNRHYWGQGYITEAALPVADYGFETLKLNRLSAIVFTDNTASMRVLEKLGMVREGCLRHYRTTRGQPDDVYVYAVLRADWQSLMGEGSHARKNS